jgi:hypothetical protein
MHWTMSKETPAVRYQKPKILLVDLPESAATKLLAAGFNVHSGTFGQPYRVPVSDKILPVFREARLLNYNEQEVVIIDLTPPEMAEKPDGVRQFCTWRDILHIKPQG